MIYAKYKISKANTNFIFNGEAVSLQHILIILFHLASNQTQTHIETYCIILQNVGDKTSLHFNCNPRKSNLHSLHYRMQKSTWERC